METLKCVKMGYLGQVASELLDGGTLLADDVLVKPGGASHVTGDDGVGLLVDLGQSCDEKYDFFRL